MVSPTGSFPLGRPENHKLEAERVKGRGEAEEVRGPTGSGWEFLRVGTVAGRWDADRGKGEKGDLKNFFATLYDGFFLWRQRFSLLCNYI